MEIKQLKPRFVIEKCSLITQWAWDTINDSCPICRNSVNEDSITNENNPNIASVVVVGMCGHAFHYDCIGKWLKNSKNCPLCNSTWEYQKTMDKDLETIKINKVQEPVTNINNLNLPPLSVTSTNIGEDVINNNENVITNSINLLDNSTTIGETISFGDNIMTPDVNLDNNSTWEENNSTWEEDIFTSHPIINDGVITNLNISPISNNTSSIIGNISQLDNQMLDMEESIIDDEDNDEDNDISHI